MKNKEDVRMIDIYFDCVNIKRIENTEGGYRIIFGNEKDESLSLILNEANFISLYYGIKNRCEAKGLIPVRS